MKTDARQFKDAVYDQLARLGKALSSGPRLEIVDLLGQGPRTVEAIALQVGQSMANTSHHLQALRRARLVEADKDGVHVIYRLANEDVATFFCALRGLAEVRLLEIQAVVRDYHASRGEFEVVDRAALVARIRSAAVTVIDVRPTDEYRAGHLPGALSIPVERLDEQIAALPTDREVVAYCRGPYCVMALDAVASLRARGFTATVLEEGVSEWRARGLDVTIGPNP